MPFSYYLVTSICVRVGGDVNAKERKTEGGGKKGGKKNAVMRGAP